MYCTATAYFYHCYSTSTCRADDNTLSLPSKTIALISPNSGTWSGFPCMVELRPALSKSWTKWSEYCCTLDTLNTSLNVAITSPLMLLGKPTSWQDKSWCLLSGWKAARHSSSHSPIGNDTGVNIVMWYRRGREDVFNLSHSKKWTGLSFFWWSYRAFNVTRVRADLWLQNWWQHDGESRVLILQSHIILEAFQLHSLHEIMLFLHQVRCSPEEMRLHS